MRNAIAAVVFALALRAAAAPVTNSNGSVMTPNSEVLRDQPVATDVSGLYARPAGGIPAADLSEGVRESLGRADSAVQTLAPATNYVDSATNAIRRVDGAARPLPKYLHALDFSDSYPDEAKEYYRSRGDGKVDGGCSAVRDGGFVYRNFDFPFDGRAEFVVKMSAGNGRFASVGVAQVGTNLTEETVTSGKWSKWYKALPGATVDGVNENGVVCEINVSDDVPSWHSAGSLHPLGAVRWILDHATNALHGAEYVAANVRFPSGWAQNFHYMVADRGKTYLVENGEVYDFDDYHEPDEPATVTNFPLNRFPWGGMGMERFGLLLGGANITNAWYTRAYRRETTPPWTSEFPPAVLVRTNEIFDAWASHPREYFRGGTNGGEPWWQTVHTSVYDITNRTLRIAVQETDDWYAFRVPGSDAKDMVAGKRDLGDRSFSVSEPSFHPGESVDWDVVSVTGTPAGLANEGSIRTFGFYPYWHFASGSLFERDCWGMDNGNVELSTDPDAAELSYRCGGTLPPAYREEYGEECSFDVVMRRRTVTRIDSLALDGETDAKLYGNRIRLGESSSADADGAVAIGRNARVRSANSIAVGSSAYTSYSTRAIAIGTSASATNNGAVAVGNQARSHGPNTFNVPYDVGSWYAGDVPFVESLFSVGWTETEVEEVVTNDPPVLAAGRLAAGAGTVVTNRYRRYVPDPDAPKPAIEGRETAKDLAAMLADVNTNDTEDCGYAKSNLLVAVSSKRDLDDLSYVTEVPGGWAPTEVDGHRYDLYYDGYSGWYVEKLTYYPEWGEWYYDDYEWVEGPEDAETLVAHKIWSDETITFVRQRVEVRDSFALVSQIGSQAEVAARNYIQNNDIAKTRTMLRTGKPGEYGTGWGTLHYQFSSDRRWWSMIVPSITASWTSGGYVGTNGNFVTATTVNYPGSSNYYRADPISVRDHTPIAKFTSSAGTNGSARCAIANWTVGITAGPDASSPSVRYDPAADVGSMCFAASVEIDHAAGIISYDCGDMSSALPIEFDRSDYYQYVNHYVLSNFRFGEPVVTETSLSVKCLYDVAVRYTSSVHAEYTAWCTLNLGCASESYITTNPDYGRVMTDVTRSLYYDRGLKATWRIDVTNGCFFAEIVSTNNVTEGVN